MGFGNQLRCVALRMNSFRITNQNDQAMEAAVPIDWVAILIGFHVGVIGGVVCGAFLMLAGEQ